jgi:glycerol-3-phosphate dehydrogenase
LVQHHGIEEDIATYLNRAYGDQATRVLEIAKGDGYTRLAAGHAYLEAEVRYGASVESARTVVDILARRLRLGFLDHKATLAAIDRVAELLAAELGWSADRREQACAEARDYFA